MPNPNDTRKSSCAAYLLVLIVFALTAILGALLYPFSDIYLLR